MQVDRRTVLRGGAIGVAGFAGGMLVGRSTADDSNETGAAPVGSSIAFRGVHQAGIATPAPRHATFGAFDIVERDRAAVAALLEVWTDAAESLTAGTAVADDSGEASDIGPASLTITVGFAASVFDDKCAPRSARPAGLVDVPTFDGDALEEQWNGGDLLVQACADDPTVVSHALRQLRRLAAGTATLRWSQSGFVPVVEGRTPRNLFGQVDGTANPLPGSDEFDDLVWLGDDESQPWMRGGTYLGMRRIRMQVSMWDRMGLDVQEASIGRRRDTGAPLTGGDEFTPMDLDASATDGSPVIADDAHARVARLAGPGMFRRGYSFDNGPRRTGTEPVDPSEPMNHDDHTDAMHDTATMAMDDQDSGLMFVAFVRDPQQQFVEVQRALSASDALGHFLAYTSSALWAIPGGTMSGSIAADLFA